MIETRFTNFKNHWFLKLVKHIMFIVIFVFVFVFSIVVVGSVFLISINHFFYFIFKLIGVAQ